MSKKFPDVNININNINEIHNNILSDYVKKLALKYLEVEEGRVLAKLENLKEYRFLTGAISGQVLMSAIDTVMSMAMSTSSKSQRGTYRKTITLSNQVFQIIFLLKVKFKGLENR